MREERLQEGGRESASMTELELRFQLGSPDDLVARLRERAGLPREVRISDTYFVPEHVVDYDSHEAWLEEGVTGPLRLRETRADGHRSRSIQAKRPAFRGNYSLNLEAKLEIGRVADGTAFAEALGYRRLITLEKVRRHWVLPVAHVHLDSYEDGPHIVEIEARDASVPPESLRSIASDLALSEERELVASSALTLIRAFLTDASSTPA